MSDIDEVLKCRSNFLLGDDKTIETFKILIRLKAVGVSAKPALFMCLINIYGEV